MPSNLPSIDSLPKIVIEEVQQPKKQVVTQTVITQQPLTLAMPKLAEEPRIVYSQEPLSASSEIDQFDQFVLESLDTTGKVARGYLYSYYLQYCQSRNMRPLNHKDFNEAVRTRLGASKLDTRENNLNVHLWQGISLRS